MTCDPVVSLIIYRAFHPAPCRPCTRLSLSLSVARHRVQRAHTTQTQLSFAAREGDTYAAKDKRHGKYMTQEGQVSAGARASARLYWSEFLPHRFVNYRGTSRRHNQLGKKYTNVAIKQVKTPIRKW
ncbi:hypothetical protein CBL_07989 [Carabus blaptoides fortunei]